MTMRNQILKVAARLGNPAKSAKENAMERGWIDAHGLPTEKGYRLVDALNGRASVLPTLSNAA